MINIRNVISAVLVSLLIPNVVLSADFSFRGTAAETTAALQRMLDAGGETRVLAGDYEISGVTLRSGTVLRLEKGARLLSQREKSGFVGHAKRAIIFAEDAEDIAIVGEGTIDGRGGAAVIMGHEDERQRGLYFIRCRNVRLADFTLRNPDMWSCYFRECDGVIVKGVTIYSHANYNNDGIDIEAKNVLIENCTIDSDDDAICFKSDNPAFAVENCEVRGCTISANCNYIKCGTSSYGTFRNLFIHDCTLREGSPSKFWDWKQHVPGAKISGGGISGVALEVVDGGVMENVICRNLTMESGVQTPIFIRQESRHTGTGASVLRHILIENVTATSTCRLASSITGVEGRRPADITIRNVKFALTGGGTMEDVEKSVPEQAAGYPENRMFKGHVLPAYGFYVRHADNIRFEKIELSLLEPDARPALYTDDASVSQRDCRFE